MQRVPISGFGRRCRGPMPAAVAAAGVRIGTAAAFSGVVRSRRRFEGPHLPPFLDAKPGTSHTSAEWIASSHCRYQHMVRRVDSAVSCIARAMRSEYITTTRCPFLLCSRSDYNPCNGHLRELAQSVKNGIREAGGFPMEAPGKKVRSAPRYFTCHPFSLHVLSCKYSQLESAVCDPLR